MKYSWILVLYGIVMSVLMKWFNDDVMAVGYAVIAAIGYMGVCCHTILVRIDKIGR